MYSVCKTEASLWNLFICPPCWTRTNDHEGISFALLPTELRAVGDKHYNAIIPARQLSNYLQIKNEQYYIFVVSETDHLGYMRLQRVCSTLWSSLLMVFWTLLAEPFFIYALALLALNQWLFYYQISAHVVRWIERECLCWNTETFPIHPVLLQEIIAFLEASAWPFMWHEVSTSISQTLMGSAVRRGPICRRANTPSLGRAVSAAFLFLFIPCVELHRSCLHAL